MMHIAQRLALSLLMCLALTAQAQSPSPQVKFVTNAGEFVVEVDIVVETGVGWRADVEFRLGKEAEDGGRKDVRAGVAEFF